MPAPLPSLSALESGDSGRLSAELLLARLKSDATVVLTLADAAALANARRAEGLLDPIIEEMARLGCRLLEAAGALAKSTRLEDNARFTRRASSGSVH
jgi:hypothetical protein